MSPKSNQTISESAIEVLTEAPTEADLDISTVCHLFPALSEVSFCGVPRSEQARHGYHSHHWPQERYCSACGLPRCPRCAREAYRS